MKQSCTQAGTSCQPQSCLRPCQHIAHQLPDVHNSHEPGGGLCDPCLSPFCATTDGQPCTGSLVRSAFAKLMLIASACACGLQHVASVKHESGRQLHFQADGRTSDAAKASSRQPVVQCCAKMIQMYSLICQVASSVSCSILMCLRNFYQAGVHLAQNLNCPDITENPS